MATFLEGLLSAVLLQGPCQSLRDYMGVQIVYLITVRNIISVVRNWLLIVDFIAIASAS